MEGAAGFSSVFCAASSRETRTAAKDSSRCRPFTAPGRPSTAHVYTSPAPAQGPAPRAAHADFMAKAETRENARFEALIAGRWLHYVGILAVLFAVGFRSDSASFNFKSDLFAKKYAAKKLATTALGEMLWPAHRWILTLAVLGLAAAHVAVERALSEKEGRDSRVERVLFAGLAMLFVTLAIPIRLDGKWITIAWAIEGAILIWSGLRIRIFALRIAGFALFAIAAARLALIPIPARQFLLNARFAAFVTVFIGLGIAANAYAIAALSLEFWDLCGRMPALGIDRTLAQQLALSTLWLVYALGLMVAGVRRKSAPLRWQALAILGVVIVKVFFFDLSALDRFYRIVSFLLLGVALLVISFYYQRRLQARGSEVNS
jgi:uncharacterized membrane protein